MDFYFRLLIALLIFFVLPMLLLFAPFFWYGRRHHWGIKQYAPLMPIFGLGWFVVFGVYFLKAPPAQILRIAAILLVPSAIYAWGLVGWERFGREARAKRKPQP